MDDIIKNAQQNRGRTSKDFNNVQCFNAYDAFSKWFGCRIIRISDTDQNPNDLVRISDVRLVNLTAFSSLG